MATIFLRHHGISPTLKSDGLSFSNNLNGSSQPIYDVVSSGQQQPVRKFVYPGSMKIVQQSHGPSFSTNRPISQVNLHTTHPSIIFTTLYVYTKLLWYILFIVIYI